MESVKSVTIYKSNHLLSKYLQYGKKPMNASNNTTTTNNNNNNNDDNNNNIVILINIGRMLIKIL